MSRPYRDNVHSTASADILDYYDTIPPPHALAGGSVNPSTASLHNLAAGADTHNGVYHRPFAADSTYELSDVPRTDADSSQWIDESRSSGRRSKRIVIGAVMSLLVLIGVGVALGVTLSHKKSASSASSSSNSSSVVKTTDPNDPSTFVKDPKLIQSFYGIAYTPEGSQLPECGNTLEQVIQDIQLLSQLTTRIRLYGADCNQSSLVLEAIKQTKVNMTVFLGNYPVATDNNAAYSRQRDEIQTAIKTYGTDHIAGITVGNEFMLNYLDANGASDPNSDIGNQGAALLIADINDTRSMLAGMSLDKTLPVGTSDAGAYFNNLVLAAVDYGMANVHPWFGNVSIDGAAGWTATFFNDTDVAAARLQPNNPQMYIAETGWPSNSSDVGNESNGPSTATEPNLQTFLDTFVCQANANGTGYFFFEYFDEEWKDQQFGGVEGWWGLFYQNRTLKNINIPDCSTATQ